MQLEFSGHRLECEPDLSSSITDKAVTEDRNRWTYEDNAEAYSEA